MQKPPYRCFRKTAGRFLLKFDCYFGCLYSDTTSPGRDDQRSSRAEAETACGSRITGIPPLRGSLRAAPFGTGVPTLVLSSQDRSATICFLDGRTRFPPYLPRSCRYSAQVDLRAPSNVAAHSLSLQGTPTDVFQFLDIHFGRFTKRLLPVPGKVPLTTYPVSKVPVAEISKNFP